MDVDEARLARGSVVTVCQRDNDPLVQAHDQLGVILAEEGIEEPDLEGAGVGKEILDARGFHLRDDKLPSRPGHLGGTLAVFRRLEWRQE